MSLASHPRIFTKSNLVYILLSITIAHISNFIINSPLSTWQEFPPELPNSVYLSLFFTPVLLFISLTFEPIQTRKRFYILSTLTLLFLSIPISFRGGKYPFALHGALVSNGVVCALKMLLFLKLNRTYLNQKDSDQKKEFKPFLWTLFSWRFNSYIIAPKSANSNEKEHSLIITSPTTSQVNKKLINRLIIIIAKWIIFELALFTLPKYATEVPEKAYQIRLVEFITKGISPITMPLMSQYLICLIVVYLFVSLQHDINIIMVTIFFRLFLHFTSEKNNYKPIIIRSGLLTPSEYVDLNDWTITFLFNTKHLFSEPWMASSPRDLWSVRWQLMLNECFKELGYLPARNLFSSFVPKNIEKMMGVLGAFGVSALVHEYLIIGDFDSWTGEHFFFFIIHGVILILWETVFGYENKNENAKIKRFLKWILLVVINLSVLPAFIEPVKRSKLFDSASYFARYYTN